MFIPQDQKCLRKCLKIFFKNIFYALSDFLSHGDSTTKFFESKDHSVLRTTGGGGALRQGNEHYQNIKFPCVHICSRTKEATKLCKIHFAKGSFIYCINNASSRSMFSTGWLFRKFVGLFVLHLHYCGWRPGMLNILWYKK